MKRLPIFQNDFKEVELPTFIDMVFLLLVFFIVNLSFDVLPVPVKPSQIELPRASGNAAMLEGGKISTLTLQVEKENTDVPNSRKLLSVIRPDAGFQTEDEALADIRLRMAQTPPDCSQCAVFNTNFLSVNAADLESQRAFSLIRESIKDYRDRYLNTEDICNTIEIITDATTEFKIINYIFQQCQDDELKIGDISIPRSVPKITFRVMPSKQSAQTTE